MPNYQFFGSYTKEWKVSNGVVEFEYDFQIRKAKCLYKANNCVHEISLVNIVGISSLALEDQQKLIKFLDNTYVKPSLCSDGSYKLYVNGRMHGGGNIEPGSERLWPNAVVPFNVNINTFPENSKEYKTIMDAIANWNAENTGFLLIPRTNQKDYIEFDWNRNASHSCLRNVEYCSICESHVGRQGGKQLINCDLLSASNFNLGSIMHEIGHALGLYHEQQRYDRDTYVKVLDTILDNDPNYGRTYEREAYLGYDFKSIMHYHFFDDQIVIQTILDPTTKQLKEVEVDRHRKMQIKSTLPAYQHQQIVELGLRQATPTNQLDNYRSRTVEGKLDNNMSIWNGVFQVGNQQTLSEGDIAAANHLAALACNPNTFKQYAIQQQQSGESDKAIEYYVIAADVFSKKPESSDWDLYWDCHYQIAIEQIKLRQLNYAKDNLNNILQNTNPGNQWYEIASSKLSEIVQNEQQQKMTQQSRGMHFTSSSNGRY